MPGAWRRQAIARQRAALRSADRIHRSRAHDVAVRREADVVERIARDERQRRYVRGVENTDIQRIRREDILDPKLVQTVWCVQFDAVCDPDDLQRSKKNCLDGRRSRRCRFHQVRPSPRRCLLLD